MKNPETLTPEQERIEFLEGMAAGIEPLKRKVDTLTTRLREVEEERDDARERATFNARLADQRFREGAEIRSLLALAVADAEGPWDFAWVPAAKAALSTERTPT